MPTLPKNFKVLWRSLELDYIPKSFYRVSVFLLGWDGLGLLEELVLILEVRGGLLEHLLSILEVIFKRASSVAKFLYFAVCGMRLHVLLEELRLILEDRGSLLEHLPPLLAHPGYLLEQPALILEHRTFIRKLFDILEHPHNLLENPTSAIRFHTQ